jgi:tetratricopeptide (TPR) repeat protein
VSEALDQEIRTLQSIFWSERDPDGLSFAALADAFLRKGDLREALDLLTDGTSRHPDYATGHVVATRLYLEQGMHAEAEFAARRVLDLDPENAVALSALVTVLHANGEEDEAAVVRSALVDADPDSEEARAVALLPLPDAVAVTDEVVVEALPESTGADDRGGLDDAGRAEVELTELAEALSALGLSDTETEFATLEELDQDSGDPALARLFDEPGLGDDGAPVVRAPYDQMAAGDVTFDPMVDLDTFGDAAVDEGEATLPLMDMGGLAPDESVSEMSDLDTSDALVDLDPVAELHSAVDLAALAPEDVAIDLGTLAPDEPVLDLGALTPDEGVMDLGALAPDEVVMDLGGLAPDEPIVELDAPSPDEPAMDLSALAPDEPAMDLSALAPDEPAMDLGALAPDEVVMDLGSLAPDEPVLELGALGPEEPAMDLSALAPDEVVMDLGALAPDEPVMELGALAPNESVEEPAIDLGALAPDEPTMDLGELAPDEPAMDLGELAPDEPAIELGALAPDDFVDDLGFQASEVSQKEDPHVDSGEPVYTRTLAELYVRQGFTDQALDVYRHLLAEEPEAQDLRDRVSELEGRGPSASRPSAVDIDEQVETLARDLAESGAEAHEVDTPFAWAPEGDSASESSTDGDGVDRYFEDLLDWGSREDI